jgi:serine/threonine protein kinase
MNPCASQEQLKRFVGDQLDDFEREIVAGHLDGCTACQAFLDRITRAPGTHERPSSGPEEAKQDARLLERLKAEGRNRLEFAEPSELTTDRAGSDAAARVSPSTAKGDFDGPLPSPDSCPSIDGFRIIREVGRGGMGVVYEAEEERLSRRVALKVLRASLHMQAKHVQRFEREARAAGRLQHNNIVPVFGSGHQEGRHYYFMRYIEGRGFDAVIRELRRRRKDPSGLVLTGELSTITDRDRLAYDSLAQIGLQVALALEHAHGQGVLHRDIKPSNLLLDTKGNVWVTDFGLAKTLEADDLTSTGDVLGTIRYMAPERFAGQGDARSDLYSLGLTLYELVALRPAYEAVDRYELIERMRHDDPASLRKLDPRFPRDLDTIVGKLVAREPARRYSTAAALADDLRRFLEDRPIQARALSPPERLIRWCKRNRWASAFLLALGIGIVASGWQAIRATSAERLARRAEATTRNERDRAEHARDRALEAVRELLLLENGQEAAFLTAEMRSSHRALLVAGIRESRELVHELEGYPEAGLQLVGAYHSLARLEFQAGDRPKAIELAREAVVMAESLHDRDKSFRTARSLGFALQLLSTVLPELKECELAAKRSTAIFEALLATSPPESTEQLIGMIAGNHINMGIRDFDQQQYREAIDHFMAAASVCQNTLKQFGPSPSRLNLLAYTRLNLCRVYRYTQRFNESSEVGREAAVLYRRLHADHPDQYDYGQNLQLTCQELGFGCLDIQKPDEAITWFEEARKTLRSMAATLAPLVSRTAQIQSDIAVVDFNVRMATESDTVRFAAPRRDVIHDAYEICDKLALVQPLSVSLRRIYGYACLYMALYQEWDGNEIDLTLLRKSEQLWEEIRRVDPAGGEARGYLVIVRRKLAEVSAARGDREEASRWRPLSLTTARGDADLCYEIALEYARMIGPIDRLPTTLSAHRRGIVRQGIVDDTITMLHEAAAAGFKDAPRMRDDLPFAPIRSLAAFEAISADVQFPASPFAPP